MSRVDFYHLKSQSLEAVLPKLLEKALDTKQNIKIKVGTNERIEFINSLLWTYDEESFLPHGTAKDGNTSSQPIFISDGDDLPNAAKLLFLVDGAYAADLSKFDRVFNVFDESALLDAREFWKEIKSSGHECFYWQQDNNGKWTMR